MNTLVSPYHLTTRETPVLAAALLSREVCTFLPTPVEADRAGVRLAIRRHPAYLRLLESWRWAAPLFKARVIRTLCSGDDPAESVAAAVAAMDDAPRYRELSAFVDRATFDDAERRLEALSVDMLKGGPDPGVSVPVAAAMDHFAARHSMVSVRLGASAAGEPGATSASLTQRAESVIGETMLSLALPTLTSASAEEILDLRSLLVTEREALNVAIDDAIDAPSTAKAQAARSAAAAFGAAFERESHGIVGHDDRRGVRCTSARVTLVFRTLPGDAAFVSSTVALRQARARGFRGGGERVSAKAVDGGQFAAKPVRALVVAVSAAQSPAGRKPPSTR